MQDRYAGDIGDFGKIGLLKALREVGLSIGVNWYKVDALETEKKADGSFKRSDGKYKIPEELFPCDPELADRLLDISCSEERSIKALEDGNFIPGAIYFNEPLTVTDRTGWHERALNKLNTADIVFVDPDNGMLVKSIGKKSARSIKYTFYEEVRNYLEQDQSVLIYNHRCRKPEERYFQDICDKLEKHTGIKANYIQKITFPKCAVRDYLAIPASFEHAQKIKDAFLNMEKGMWGRLGVCRIPK